MYPWHYGGHSISSQYIPNVHCKPDVYISGYKRHSFPGPPPRDSAGIKQSRNVLTAKLLTAPRFKDH